MKNVVRAAIGILISLVLSVTFASTAAHADQTDPANASIAGVVTHDGAPLAGAHVDLFYLAHTTFGDGWYSTQDPTIVTGADGAYSFTGKGGGDYAVCAFGDGLQEQCFNHNEWFPTVFDYLDCGLGCVGVLIPADDITVPVSGHVTNINFALRTKTFISGTVTNADTGEPVPSVRVDVFNGNVLDSGITDSAGHYSLAVAPSSDPGGGGYRVCVETSASPANAGSNLPSRCLPDRVTVPAVVGLSNVDVPLTPLREVVPEDQHKTFGDPDPAFTFHLEGVLPSDHLTSQPTCGVSGAHSAVGIYDITCTGGTLASGDPLVSTTATFTVGEKLTQNVPLGAVGHTYQGKVSLLGVGKVTFSTDASTMPPGLKLASTGAITGTPTKPGTYPVTLTVQKVDAIESAFITIIVTPMRVVSTTMPAAVLGRAYSKHLVEVGGTGPWTWSLTGGVLPNGVHLASGGQLSGTPTAAGTFHFTVSLHDSAKPVRTATATVTLVVKPMTITTTALPDGKVGTGYSATLTRSGGIGAVTWKVSGGALPAGMTLSAAGHLGGTPKTAGTYTFAVTVTDSANPAHVATRSLTIHVT